jgi:uncharacterized MAPEG superfamily protein
MRMSTELVILGWSVVLLLVQVILQTQFAVNEFGLPYSLSPRDDRKVVSGAVGARAGRALYNLLETYPAFVAMALAVTVAGKAGGTSALGAEIWFLARIVYVPVYLMGLKGVRTGVWAISIIGLVLMVYGLLA